MDALARQRSATVAVWRADSTSRPAGDWTQVEDLALHTTGIALPGWSGVHVTGTSTPWAQVPRWFEERAVPWGVLVPAELDVLPPSTRVGEQRVMLRDLSDLDPLPDLDLRWDAGPDAAAIQAEAFQTELADATSFVLPKLVNPACAVVTAYVDDVPLATATLVAVDGVAAVYGVGTAVAGRRQGLGRAVTLAVLHEGRARDCDLAFLNPSDLGYGTYAALGFRDAPPFGIWASF